MIKNSEVWQTSEFLFQAGYPTESFWTQTLAPTARAGENADFADQKENLRFQRASASRF